MKRTITVLMDYDGTLHDHDSIITNAIDGYLGQSGQQLYHTWRYRIHRDIIHSKFLNRHDDMLFHARLLFNYYHLPYNHSTAKSLVQIFDEADHRAKDDPIYFCDAIPALNRLNEMGINLCLSTGRNAIEKARTLEKYTGINYFQYIFSEPSLGYLKTAPEYYKKALTQANANSNDTYSVGDTPLSDIRPAKMIGITTIWLNRVNESFPKKPDSQPHYTVKDLNRATEIIIENID
jgi:HAD superfamily hydrolase (TIGR01549 family)